MKKNQKSYSLRVFECYGLDKDNNRLIKDFTAIDGRHAAQLAGDDFAAAGGVFMSLSEQSFGKADTPKAARRTAVLEFEETPEPSGPTPEELAQQEATLIPQ